MQDSGDHPLPVQTGEIPRKPKHWSGTGSHRGNLPHLPKEAAGIEHLAGAVTKPISPMTLEEKCIYMWRKQNLTLSL